MKINPISVQKLLEFRQSLKKTVPTFSMEKIKAKLKMIYARHEALRKSSPENKERYPRIHQSVQSTAWELVRYYLRHWGKANAANYELRITHSYLKQALNDSCCIATIKNHINKLLAMSNGFITAKFRGGLGINPQNTPCIVLVLNKDVLIFNDERHNQAMAQDEIAAEEKRLRDAHTRRQATKAAQLLLKAREQKQMEGQHRRKTPSSIGDVFKSSFLSFGKRE